MHGREAYGTFMPQAIRAVINGTEMAPTGDYNPANRKRAKGHAASANRRCETPV